MAFVAANLSAGSSPQTMALGGAYAASDVGGIDLQILGPAPTNNALEARMLTAASGTAKDGIVEENLAPPMFTKPLAQIVAKNIPVVAVDSAPTLGSNVTLFVGSDNYALGAALAQQVIKALPAKASGTIVVNDASLSTPVFGMRAKGAMDTLSKALPNVKVIEGNATCLSGGNAVCTANTTALIKANAGALAFIGTGAIDGPTLAQLKKQQGSKAIVAGFAITPPALQAIKDGSELCTMSPEQYLKGYVATRLLAQAVASGKPLAKGWFDLPAGLMREGERAAG